MPPRIDFYVLDKYVADGRLRATCRLCKKIHALGHRAYVQTADSQQAKQLDDLLWTFRAGSFIPHGVYTQTDAEEPVALGHASEPAGHNDVLVNLSDEIPAYFSRFNRVAELVGPDEQERTAARERYRYYQDRGYTLNTHKL